MKCFMLPCLLCLIFSCQLSSALASSRFVAVHEQGWQWYHETLPLKTQNKKVNPISPTSPSLVMKALREQVESARDLAILKPTLNNVSHYIQLQNKVSSQAGLFAKRWQQALLNSPELNYSLEHPTNKLGRDVYFQEQQTQEEAAIKQLFSHSGLFFFFKSSCPYCHRFAPIIKSFSEQYQIPVVAISLDGGALAEFPHAHIDQGQAKKFNINRWPALFAVNPYNQQAIPISYGLLSWQDLRARILMVAQQLNGQQNNEAQT